MHFTEIFPSAHGKTLADKYYISSMLERNWYLTRIHVKHTFHLRQYSDIQYSLHAFKFFKMLIKIAFYIWFFGRYGFLNPKACYKVLVKVGNESDNMHTQQQNQVNLPKSKSLLLCIYGTVSGDGLDFYWYARVNLSLNKDRSRFQVFQMLLLTILLKCIFLAVVNANSSVLD